MNYEQLTLNELSGDILLITLNRPPVNALSQQLVAELAEVFADHELMNRFRAVILQGSGKHFCAGADLKERRAMSDEDVRQFVPFLQKTLYSIHTASPVTLALMKGAVLGGGFELALACDFRITPSRVKIALPEASLGIIPGAGGTQYLPRLIGISKAKQLLYASRTLNGKEAYDWGIADQLNDEKDQIAAAVRWLAPILTNAPIAVRQIKMAVQEGLNVSLKEGLDREREVYETTIQTEDRREALEAFLERRKPEWKGR